MNTVHARGNLLLTNIIAVGTLLAGVLLPSLSIWIAIAVWILWILAPQLGLRRKPLLLVAILLTIWVVALFVLFGTTGSLTGGTEVPVAVP